MYIKAKKTYAYSIPENTNSSCPNCIYVGTVCCQDWDSDGSAMDAFVCLVENKITAIDRTTKVVAIFDLTPEAMRNNCLVRAILQVAHTVGIITLNVSYEVVSGKTTMEMTNEGIFAHYLPDNIKSVQEIISNYASAIEDLKSNPNEDTINKIKFKWRNFGKQEHCIACQSLNRQPKDMIPCAECILGPLGGACYLGTGYSTHKAIRKVMQDNFVTEEELVQALTNRMIFLKRKLNEKTGGS